MKRCPACELTQADATTVCNCGAERHHRTSGFVWLGIVALASISLLFVGGVVSHAGKSPEDLARERARDCMKTWQEHYSSQGYKRDMIQIGAVMKCSQELKALDRYDKTKR